MATNRTHCEHGSYIGYPGGLDYLCQWCEDGITLEQFLEIRKVDLIRHLRRKVDEGERFCEFFRAERWDRPGMMIAKVVPYVMTYYGPAFDQLAELEGTHA